MHHSPDAFTKPYVPPPYDDDSVVRQTAWTGLHAVVTDFRRDGMVMLAQEQVVDNRLAMRIEYDEQTRLPVMIQTEEAIRHLTYDGTGRLHETVTAAAGKPPVLS